MNVTLPIFMKHAQKVTKTASAGRPILHGVYFRKDGALVVTDSHRMYLATESHSQTGEVVQNPKTGEYIDGNYPDVSRLVPDKVDAKAVITLNNIDYHVKSVKAIQQVATIPKRNGDSFTKKISTIVSITNDSGREVLLTTYDSGATANYTIGLAEEASEPIKLSLNAEYLAQALDIFKDAGIRDVTLYYYGSLRPFTLEGGNMTALILPMRTIRVAE